jgi:hypothetical protein
MFSLFGDIDARNAAQVSRGEKLAGWLDDFVNTFAENVMAPVNADGQPHTVASLVDELRGRVGLDGLAKSSKATGDEKVASAGSGAALLADKFYELGKDGAARMVEHVATDKLAGLDAGDGWRAVHDAIDGQYHFCDVELAEAFVSGFAEGLALSDEHKMTQLARVRKLIAKGDPSGLPCEAPKAARANGVPLSKRSNKTAELLSEICDYVLVYHVRPTHGGRDSEAIYAGVRQKFGDRLDGLNKEKVLELIKRVKDDNDEGRMADKLPGYDGTPVAVNNNLSDDGSSGDKTMQSGTNGRTN